MDTWIKRVAGMAESESSIAGRGLFLVAFSYCAETMEPLLIETECHASYKADETPRLFRFERNWIEVEEVVDRWHQVECLSKWPRADYFKVQADDGRLYLLKHDLDASRWILVRRW